MQNRIEAILISVIVFSMLSIGIVFAQGSIQTKLPDLAITDAIIIGSNLQVTVANVGTASGSFNPGNIAIYFRSLCKASGPYCVSKTPLDCNAILGSQGCKTDPIRHTCACKVNIRPPIQKTTISPSKTTIISVPLTNDAQKETSLYISLDEPNLKEIKTENNNLEKTIIRAPAKSSGIAKTISMILGMFGLPPQ